MQYIIEGDDYDNLLAKLDGMTHGIVNVTATVSHSEGGDDERMSRSFRITIEADLTPEQISSLPIVS